VRPPEVLGAAGAVRAGGSDSFAHWTWAAMLARIARCSGVI
jgi:hypothetical protein